MIGTLVQASFGLSNDEQSERVLGGPDPEETAYHTNSLVTALNTGSIPRAPGFSADPYMAGSGSVVSANNPSSTAVEARDGTVIHSVGPGENLSVIAANYGVSLNTILAANNTGSVIHPGDNLIIPPVSGVMHPFEGDESVDAVAALYGVSVDDILSANSDLSSGSLIIPGATELMSPRKSASNLPKLDSYFLPPTPHGFNWKKLHGLTSGFPAVDFANNCGAEVLGSNEGLVSEVSTNNSWNQGYGNMVIIKHPNDTETLYAHMQEVFVEYGSYVAQGDVIGTVGNTGHTTEGTLTSSGFIADGCHVHFGVKGARNPFAL
jgi:LysM repeat protein